jgi:hypothetical protein
MVWLASARISAFSTEMSDTWREWPISSAETSTSKFSGMWRGSTSTSISRRNCSSTPPALRTPSGVPTSASGTLSVIFSPAWISKKSTCQIVFRVGCRWISRISARSGTPSTESSITVEPEVPCSTFSRSARFSEMDSVLRPEPYTTAGTNPACRSLRAAPVPALLRRSALTVTVCAIPSATAPLVP